MEHTKLPYKADLEDMGTLSDYSAGYIAIYSTDINGDIFGQPSIAYTLDTNRYGEKVDLPARANAEFIVKACNSYYDNQAEIARLRGVLKKIAPEWKRQQNMFPILQQDGWMNLIVKEIDQALTESNQPLEESI